MASSLATRGSLTNRRSSAALVPPVVARKAPSSRAMQSPKVVAVAAAGNGEASPSSSPSSSDTPLSLATSILHPEKCFVDPYNALSTPLYQVIVVCSVKLLSKR